MTEKDQHPAPTYRIGTVSRLTGVPADTLRVWERRYRVVTPIRSESGTRLYGAEDLGRLTLIKRLVERGDAISTVASLTLVQLRERLEGTGLAEPEPGAERPCRVAVLGADLAGRLRRAAPQSMAGIEVLGLFDRPEVFLATTAGTAPDLVIFEYAAVQPDQVREIGDLLAASGAPRGLLVYHFAARATLVRLEARQILSRRAPVELADLCHACLALHQARQGELQHADDADESLALDLSRPLPPRRFAPAQLEWITAAATSLRCECPRHLVDLIAALSAFESYSEGCEDRHPEDAALHAWLHTASAQARALMESALARVVAAEGIAVGPPGADLA